MDLVEKLLAGMALLEESSPEEAERFLAEAERIALDSGEITEVDKKVLTLIRRITQDNLRDEDGTKSNTG